MTLTCFEIVQGDEHLTSNSGLALIGALLERSGVRAACDAIPGAVPERDGYTLGQLATAMTGLICVGKPDFDAIEEQRGQPFFAQALGLPSCPSAPTLRQRLQAAESILDESVRRAGQDVVGRTARRIKGVSTPRHGELVPLEMDVVVFDNSKTQKEGLGWTYHRCMGFAPIFSHVGIEGYLVDVELRTGEKHSQSETTPAFLRSSILAARRMLGAKDPRILAGRFDAGFDSQDNIMVCQEEGIRYCIARNRRRESEADWLAIAKEHGVAQQPRPGKTVWLGEIFRTVQNVRQRIVFEVTERTTKRIEGGYQTLIVPEIDIETFWTDLTDTPADIIHFYHGRGTSEQFHSEIKTDLDLERLPSGTFATNQLIMLLGMLAYNCLRLMGQEALRDDPEISPTSKPPLRKRVKRRRLRSVMDDLIHLAARVVHSGRRWKLAFGRHAPWAATWERLYRAFLQPASA
jgi:Transposase DDE domain group 1